MSEAGSPEVRIDPLTGLRAILAPGRADRPFEFELAGEPAVSPEDCAFCAGHEDRTPPELYSVRADGGWAVRVVPNKYPALVDGHEVVIHSPEHLTSLADLDEAQLGVAMEAWRERMRHHSGVPCRHLIVNEGAMAGASLEHTHAQLFALPFVPATVAREREHFTAHNTRTMGSCLLCDLLAEEVRSGERLVAIDDEAALIAPWASRSPLHLRIVPRRHSARFEDDEGVGAAMLATALRLLVKRLGGKPPLNLWVRSAPSGADHFHWYIDIVPRLTVMAGLELGAGINLNVYPPERAAAELRG